MSKGQDRKEHQEETPSHRKREESSKSIQEVDNEYLRQVSCQGHRVSGGLALFPSLFFHSIAALRRNLIMCEAIVSLSSLIGLRIPA